MKLPEGTLTIFKKQKSTQEEQSPVQSPRPHNLGRKPKRKKSTPTGNPKQLVVADDNDSADDKKPKRKRTKPENKLIIGQDPQPISSEDSVKKFETRMTSNHLFQPITEINKPTDLTKEPDAPYVVFWQQVPLNGNNVLDIKQEDVVAILDLPRGPKPVEEFKQNDPAITDHAEMVDAFKKRMGYSNKFLPTRSTTAQLIAGRKDFGDDFKRDFLVFVVSTFLHGNTTSRIIMNILKPLLNMNEVTEYNWCQYVIDTLVKGCKSHHDGKLFTEPITFFWCEYERAHLRSFPVIKCWDQKILDDRLRLQGNNFTNDLAALYEKFYQLIITMSKTVLDIREKEMELKIEPDEQAKKIIKILTDAMVSMSRKMSPPPVGKSVPTSKEVVVDEQQTQPQEKKRSHQDSTGWDSGVTSTYTRRSRSTGTRKRKVFKDPTIPHFNLGIFSSQEDSYETTQEKNTEEDITGSVDLDKDVNETIEAEEYPVPSALDETKNPTPSIDEIIRTASAPASKSLSDTEKLEMIAVAAEQVEKNSKVVEAVPLSIITPDWNIASTTGGLLMLEKNECTTPPAAISKEANELDEELTKTVEKILNEKPKRRNPPRVRRLPERFRSPFMLQKKNKKKFIQWTEEKKKMTQEEALLIDFALLQRQEEIVKSGQDRTWIENSIIDAWAVILNKEEAKSDSPRRIFFGVSSFGSNKEEIEFTFYERLGLELEEQGLTVASLLTAKAIYFPIYYQDHYFLYVLLVEEKKVLFLNNIHAKDLDYYKPTKDLLFRFFKSYVACVFPSIELVSAQYTFTEVTLPSHKDKTPNAEDCGIYTMHHMEWYDGGEYEDGTT
ncbi:OLC1v1036215C1 [Oldenlandia corymbosa var. corymbosa]|uniref:OLC1v1036215C1 n=1 Tax=Oldenlandia corymbosa var. corymbosa TaxID=529605 RepID=A0AAV1CUV5_OLDCO|nr:OLC1v1036215C1 [Oldenlandia corymbosa var. corymbosa]